VLGVGFLSAPIRVLIADDLALVRGSSAPATGPSW
jgi:hypothetical protein